MGRGGFEDTARGRSTLNIDRAMIARSVLSSHPRLTLTDQKRLPLLLWTSSTNPSDYMRDLLSASELQPIVAVSSTTTWSFCASEPAD